MIFPKLLLIVDADQTRGQLSCYSLWSVIDFMQGSFGVTLLFSRCHNSQLNNHTEELLNFSFYIGCTLKTRGCM